MKGEGNWSDEGRKEDTDLKRGRGERRWCWSGKGEGIDRGPVMRRKEGVFFR